VSSRFEKGTELPLGMQRLQVTITYNTNNGPISKYVPKEWEVNEPPMCF
jgi:hypothetical protein